MNLTNISKQELLEVLQYYDVYIQLANEENYYNTGWRPVCIAEFYDCEYAQFKENERR